MTRITVSKDDFIREHIGTPSPKTAIELIEDAARRYMWTEPGLAFDFDSTESFLMEVFNRGIASILAEQAAAREAEA